MVLEGFGTRELKGSGSGFEGFGSQDFLLQGSRRFWVWDFRASRLVEFWEFKERL